MSDGGQVRLPWRLADILSGAYSVVSIIVVLVGLVAWTIEQQSRITELQHIQQMTDQRVTDQDQHGTRALSERVIAIEQRLLAADKRAVDIDHELAVRIDNIAARLNAMNSASEDNGRLAAIIKERQDQVRDQIKRLDEQNAEIRRALDRFRSERDSRTK